MCNKDLLYEIQSASFTLDDARLFLDTHPKNRDALCYYNAQLSRRDHLVSRYTREYGPLTPYDPQCPNRWAWVDDPWPWEYSEE